MFGRKPSANSEPNEESNMTGLMKILGCDNPSRQGDVVFVHGLAGHAWNTWHWQNPEDRDYQKDSFWLTWLANDLDVGIWTFGYSAARLRANGSAMPLFDQASNFLDDLENFGIGERPVVFVTHSMGGLLVKKMLKAAKTFSRNESKEAVVKSTKGIVFLSTPHLGSDVAHWVKSLAGFLTTVNVEELKAHAPQLRELDEWYRQNVDELEIKTKVYYETKPTSGVLIVNESSANPGIKDVKPIAVEADHDSIAKPKPGDTKVYLGVKQFIKQCLPSQKSLPPADNPVSLTPTIDEEKNLESFDLEWDSRRPEKSKQTITQTSSIKATDQQPAKPFHNLPQPDYGNFIGREQQLAKAMQILRPYPHSQHSLVTIDGVGGIGKSALALEIAHRFLWGVEELPQEDRFEVLVWTSAKQTILRPGSGIVTRQQVLRTLDDICESVAVTLSIEDRIRSHPRDKVGLVRRHLSQQRTLLIVDNLETVDDEAVIEFLQELPAPTKAIITTRHRIDVAYPVRLLGMKWEDSKTLIEQECLKKDVSLTEDQKRKLHDRTGGVPLAIVWSIAEIGFGYSIDSILTRLGNPKSDIARFCFESVVGKIRNTDAHKLLLALALCGNSGSREELGYVAGFADDLISTDEGLVELEKLSIVNKKGDRFNILPLTREYAEYELENNVAFGSEAARRLISYYIKRHLPSTASTLLVNHKGKLSKNILEEFLDKVVDQFWEEASGYMNDDNMLQYNPYEVGYNIDWNCSQCIKIMEAVGGLQGIQKLKKSWSQFWSYDQFISWYCGSQNTSLIQECISSLERLEEYDFLMECLLDKKHRGYTSELIQAIEKSGRKYLAQPLKNMLDEESNATISAKLQQAIELLEGKYWDDEGE